jgi:hypothetical protein
MSVIPIVILLALLTGCATHAPPNPAYFEIDPGHLPPADVTLQIPGLGPCTDNPDRSLHLNSNQAVSVLVHGCFGSSGNFRGLAQVLAFNGQQTACFTYDDRAALTQSAADLRRAVNQLAEQTSIPLITVIGHSQGALISHKSLTELPLAPPRRQAGLRLVTISGPFDGIASAQTCGRNWLRWVTLGILPASCYLVTGAKWEDITYSSPFIRHPGNLDSTISSYLKIDTDESGTCRRAEGGKCIESDAIFSLTEQHNSLVENDTRVRGVLVHAGHVEIVGDKRVAPTKLIAILQEQGVLLPILPERLAAFNQLLAQVYKEDSLPNQDSAQR